MPILKWLLILLFVLVIGSIGAGQAGLLSGSAPTDLGAHGGKLNPPSATDNSVSSQASLYPGNPQAASAQNVAG